MRVYVSGQMHDMERAVLPVLDAGFQHAVGLFETMSATHGRVFRLDAHLRRLAGSAAELGLTHHVDQDRLRQAVEQALRENNLTEARVRLTLTAGGVSLLRATSESVEPTVVVVASEPVRYDRAYFESGVMATIAGERANPFDSLAGHKTLAYWGRLRSLRQAAALGAAETIWLSVSNHLASGAVSNLFTVKDGQLFTPIAHGEESPGALRAPVLPGVTRATIMEIAQARGMNVTCMMLTISDLLDADEAFLTNSSWHVLPVTKVEKKTIGDGKVGAATVSLRNELLTLMERETQGG